jgi:cytochrome P450
MARGMSTAQRYDLYSHEFRVATHETYSRMREESPVHLQPGLDGETPIWFVTRYDDVVALLADNERFVLDPTLALTPEELVAREASSALPPPDDRVNENLLAKDGGDHRRLRRLVSKAFTPRMVQELRPRIHEIAEDLVDRVADQGRMELVDDFAFPLPITVIAELLGIPAEDQGRFRTWSNSFVLPPLTPELQEQLARHTDEFVAYLDELFTERRADPRDDLVSALVEAEDAGDHLSENELYSMVVLLIVAGHETTVSLITNAVHALLSHPDQLAQLRGDLVIAVVGSANRDPAQFQDADTLDLRRDAARRHVGFGRGSHSCLGAPLARLETEIALETLFRRLPNLRLAIAEDELYWRPIPLFRSLASLPLAWDA